MNLMNRIGNSPLPGDRRKRTPDLRARSRMRPAFEQLEARTLLAGSFANALISDAEMATILSGLDGIADFGRDLSETGEFAEPFALVKNPDGSTLSIGGLLDFGDVLDQKLAGPVRTYLEGLTPANRKTDGLVVFLDSLPEVTTVMGGLATMPTDELRFEVVFHTEVAANTFGIDFGPQGDALGLSLEDHVDMIGLVAIDTTFAFGVDRNSELNTEQAFFVRGAQFNVSADLQGPGTEFDMMVGFLETPARPTLMEEEGVFYVTVNNVVPDAFGNITLSELNGYPIDQLAEIAVTANTLMATIEVPASLGSWTAAGMPTITVTGAAFGADPTVTVNADFDELLNFNNVDAEQVLAGLNLFGTWLSGFADSTVLEVDVPFAEGVTLGFTATDDLWQIMLDRLRDANGLPRFQSAQQFADLLGIDIDFDPMAGRLEYPNLDFAFAPQQITAPLALGDSSQAPDRRCVFPLCGLATDTLATLTFASRLDFNLGIDLALPGQLPEDQITADSLVVRGGVAENAMNLAGTARYGIVGIDFAGGAYTGTSSFRADIVNPNTGDSRATLGELIAGLGDPESLLGVPLLKTGSTTLVLDDVTIQDALFVIPAGASITAAVADFAQSTVTSLVETGIGVLGNFANVTQDLLVDSVVDGLTSAVKWSISELDALKSIGVSMADLVETQVIETTADAVAFMFDTFEATTGAAARLQDVSTVFTDYVSGYVSDVVGRTITTVAVPIVDAANATLNVGLTVATDTVQQVVEFGLDVVEVATATGEALVTAVGEFAGNFVPVDADVSNSFDLDFLFDLADPTTPQAYLLTTSALTASVYVEEVSLTADGSLGVLGLGLDDGSLVIAADRLMPDPAAPATFTVGLDDSAPDGRQPIDQLDQAPLESSATGQLDFNYQVTVQPGTSPEPNRFHFRIANLNRPRISTAFVETPPDFPTLEALIDLEDNLDAFPDAVVDLLAALEEAAQLQVFGLKFPLIGDKLDGAANVFRLLGEKVNFYLSTLANFDTSAIEAALESAIQDLIGAAGDRVAVTIPSVDEVLFTIAFDGAPINVSEIFSTDLGLPALGASLDAELSVVGSYHMALSIGVSRTDGVYIDTSAPQELGVDLDVDVAGSIAGRLGFIQVNVTAGPGGSCLTAATQPTAFHAEFGIGLTDPNADGKLTVSELSEGGLIDMANTGLDGCADVNLIAVATAVDFLPSIEADMGISWDFGGSDLRGSVPEVTYDVRLNLGSFFSQVLLPILGPLEGIVEPLDRVLDVFTDPLPIISDLVQKFDGEIVDPARPPISFPDSFTDGVSITDVARLFLPPGYDLVLSAIDAIAAVVDAVAPLVDAATVEANNDTVFLDFGQLEFGTGRTSDIDARDVNQAIDLAAQVFGRPVGGDLFDQFLDETGGFGAISRNIINTEGAELNFPIFTQPLSVFEWLLGFGEAELITFKLPSVDGTLPFDLLLPILAGGRVQAGFFGEFNLHAVLGGGFDSFGFSEFARTGNVADLAKGFYISDRENADGTGPDVAEISLGGDVLVGAVLDLVVVAAGVGGGVFAEVDADLIDRDGDGKVRGDELASDEGCLELSGSVGVELGAYVELLGFIKDVLPFARAELGSFNETIQCPRFGGGVETGDVLAKLNAGTGQLNLLVGSRANERTIEQQETNESFSVYEDSGQIVVAAFGVIQSFPAANVMSIFADAGTSNDTIIVASSVTKPAELIGGDGDDVLTGGSGDDTIDGGIGNDLLDGQEGPDSIIAGDGDDTVTGGDENSPGDTIDGGLGDDEIHGGSGDDVITAGDGLNFVYGDAGNDVITGGANVDVIYGGADDDVIAGLADEDVLVGEDGNDELTGGSEDDLIDGGPGEDTLTGETGADLLYGGDDPDTIAGNDGNDYIEGGTGGDEITGGLGADTVRGGEDGDDISGNDGDDLLFGEAGNDEIRGQRGMDTIEGGTENDTIDGGDDNDLIHGDEGGDNIEGGLGDDELFGDADSDIIHGNDGLAQSGSDCDPAAEPDRDSIYGGTGGDIITGDCDDDLIFGEDGNDNIHGNDGVDVIEGGADNDMIFGDGGEDDLEGGDGNDLIDGGDQNDLARGGPGDDDMFGRGGMDTLYGDAGNDLIDGGPQADLIDGGADNDHELGQTGDDQIYGNVGSDILEGNAGADTIRGNLGEDLIYGDDGPDDIAGGPNNDTIRGGDDNDTAHGGPGDDLLLGHRGDDMLFGDAGDDVLYGYLGNDTLTGGTGNDHAFGQFGDDVLVGDDGDDILEGGPGDDTATGGPGHDALYGDAGVDDLSGGDDDDFIKAGDGVGDNLRGDNGNDHIVGSDDGDEDPNFGDTVFFGDVIDGGEGDDTIESLGGADIIKVGQGNDAVTDGTHTDQVTGGVPLPGPAATFAVSTGPDVGGHWGELNGSATDGGLTQVGGFEEATFATADGVYVAWVDWRNGSTEIYLAFHADGGSAWVEINGSAGGIPGGISNDAEQSRRPTIVQIENVDAMGNPVTELLVAWTKIDAAGATTIEVAKRDGLLWTRIANPAQTGPADNAQFTPFSVESALLGWIGSAMGFDVVHVAQYIFEPTCFKGFRTGAFGFVTAGASRPMVNVDKFDIAAVEFRAAVASSYGSPGDHDVDVSEPVRGPVLHANTLCPGAMVTVDVETPGSWGVTGTFTDGDAMDPTVGYRLVEKRSQGQNETQISTDLYVAWQQTTDREDQVVGMVRREHFDDPPLAWEELVPQFFGQAALTIGGSLSQTVGYAAKPDIATSDSYVFLAWKDDGVHGGARGDSSGRSSVFVMSALGASRTMSERLPTDASNGGISPTGGSVDSISITTEPVGLDSGSPYVVWTEARARTETVDHNETLSVYLRHDLDVPQFFVLVRSTGGSNLVTEGGPTDSFSLNLMSQPSSNVRIDLNPSSEVTVSAAQLIFTPANWFTPQVVTVMAVNDTKVEGSHTGTIALSVLSFDPDYNGLAVAPVVVQIRDNDFGITDFVPQFLVAGKKRTIGSVILATVGVLDPADVTLQNFRLSQPTATSAGKTLALRAVAFNPATELATLTPVKPMSLNKTYLLMVSNINGAAAAKPFIINVATTQTIADPDGDRATLTLAGTPGFGYFKTLGTQDPALALRTTINGTGAGIVLSGTAKRGRTGNGIVALPASQTLGVAPGTTFRSTLTNPPVRIGLAQSVIDELLTASDGTLASVLVPV